MLADSLRSEQRVELPTALLRLREYDFPQSMEDIIRLGAGQSYLNICLTSRTWDSYGSYAETLGPTEYELGRVFFVPTDWPLHVRWGPGRQRELQCLFNDEAFERLAVTWSQERLRDTLQVSCGSLNAAAARIVAEMITPGFAGAIAIESLCALMAVDLVRIFSGPRSPSPITGGLPGWRMRRIEERIRADGPPPGLTELAALCGLSPSHLRRAFRQQTGRNLIDVVTEVRTARAAELLASDDVSLKEIGHQLGFAHHTTFSTAFRRATGESPSAYRARLRVEGRSLGPRV